MVEQTDHPDMNVLSLVDRLFVLLVVNPGDIVLKVLLQ